MAGGQCRRRRPWSNWDLRLVAGPVLLPRPWGMRALGSVYALVMTPAGTPPLRPLLVAAIATAAIVLSAILAVGPRSVPLCRTTGWTGYVPLGEGVPGAAVAYQVDGSLWIPQCEPPSTRP